MVVYGWPSSWRIYAFPDLSELTMCGNAKEYNATEPSHQSHNSLDNYHTTHHFVTNNMHTCTFMLQNYALWDMGLVHCGVCATGLLCFSCPSAKKHTGGLKPNPWHSQFVATFIFDTPVFECALGTPGHCNSREHWLGHREPKDVVMTTFRHRRHHSMSLRPPVVRPATTKFIASLGFHWLGNTAVEEIFSWVTVAWLNDMVPLWMSSNGHQGNMRHNSMCAVSRLTPLGFIPCHQIFMASQTDFSAKRGHGGTRKIYTAVFVEDYYFCEWWLW